MSARATISACIISFNEERNIADCLDSVSWCDEIVVVDSFSADATAAIAQARGARVLREKWRGHVAQKNLAVDAARCDWVLSIDCDERITPRLRDAIQEALAPAGAGGAAGSVDSIESIDGFEMSRKALLSRPLARARRLVPRVAAAALPQGPRPLARHGSSRRGARAGRDAPHRSVRPRHRRRGDPALLLP
jgi:glycosyltransferase involved in cell wall biosynthesis